jgi:intracellular multiplication protein IcmV
MKNKSGSKIVQFFKRVINIREWADWDRMKGYTFFLFNAIKRLFVIDTSSSKQTFEAVKVKMGISDDELQSKQKSLLRLSLLMLAVAMFVLLYSIYHLVYGHIAAFFLSFVIALLALMLAFRYHYWHFLIKEKKLKVSIGEWFKQGILGEHNE